MKTEIAPCAIPKSGPCTGGLRIKKLLNIAAMSAVLSLLTASFAEAATYISNRSVGDGSVSLSITTDGTLGALTTANISDWTVVLTRGGASVMANSANSTFTIGGDALSATATDLLFDYSSAFDRVRIGLSGAAFQSWWCIQSTGQGCSSGGGAPSGGAEFVATAFSYTSQQYSGVQTIASINSAVPEPATWAMMIIGFGAVGSMVRTSRRRHAFSAA